MVFVSFSYLNFHFSISVHEAKTIVLAKHRYHFENNDFLVCCSDFENTQYQVWRYGSRSSRSLLGSQRCANVQMRISESNLNIDRSIVGSMVGSMCRAMQVRRVQSVQAALRRLALVMDLASASLVFVDLIR